jgi:SWI/SNF-related matrix-associated actin-dependent regulator 1 of chromatin subfamily A
MKGFYREITQVEDWIEEIKIPHGYSFVVKREAKEFVLRTMNKFTNWFIPDKALTSLMADDKVESIDISHTIDYQLYIDGESVNDPLTFTFKFNSAIYEKIKLFNIKKFTNHPPKWVVNIENIKDIDLLNALIVDFDCNISKELTKELNSSGKIKKEITKKLKENDVVRKEKEYLSRPISDVVLNKGKFNITFTSFDASFVSYIKEELIDRHFYQQPTMYWDVSFHNNNIISLHGKLTDDNWRFDKDSKAFIKEKFKLAKLAIKNAESNRIIASKLSSSELASDDFNPDLSKINGTLLPFQFVVPEYASTRKNVLIGDDMGLGKSLSALACAALFGLDDSTIIGCPAIARLTWRNEIKKWLPHATFHIAKKANSKKNAQKEKLLIMEADFVICSYNKIKIYEDVFAEKEAKLFIGDESQYLKTKTSQRYKASRIVSDSCDRVYLLSGTPLTNRPKELMTQLDMLGVLDSDFSGEKGFLFEYCDPVHNGYGYNFNGSSNLTELRTKLRESCMVRRKKDDVMKFLPPKRRIRIPVEISNRKEYDKCNDSFMYAITEKLKLEAEKNALHANSKTAIKKKDLKKYIKDYVLSGIETAAKGEIFSHTNVLRNIVGQGLVESSVEWIKSFCQGGNKLVVFAYHKDQQKALYELLRNTTDIPVGKIFGSDNDEAKKLAEEHFQSGRFQVLICSQLGANTNITLTAATTVLTLEYTYTPGNHIQAEDRCRRIGTSEDVESIDCYYMHADNTIDNYFWDMLATKFEVIENTLDTDDAEDFENIDSDIKDALFNSMFKDLMESDYIKKL